MKLEQIKKVIRTIQSCQTNEQLDAAIKYTNLSKPIESEIYHLNIIIRHQKELIENELQKSDRSKTNRAISYR